MNCSFCGKSAKEVHYLVAGPAAYICDECIEVCVSILFDHARKTHAKELTESNQDPSSPT